jgi:hypothetical protein
MSTQHQSTQYKMATPAQRKAVFGNRAETLRHVIVLIDQEAIQIQDTDWMIRCCLHVPDSAAATLVFDWMHTAPETVWRVPEVQEYVRAALTAAPQILPRICQADRRLLRSCFLGIDASEQTAFCISNLSSRWSQICKAAAISAWE